jgi:arylsulfatase A-like enzyme/Tfp pilus assembly protein PilF
MAGPRRPRPPDARRSTPPPLRRGWRGAGGAAALTVAIGTWWWVAGTARSGAVVVVSIDTLRADRLPVYGYTKGRTPAIDAFARDAILFEKAYAHAPQTLPSHASMLTGRLPFEHKVRDNLGFALAEGQTTLASVFRAAGYRTGGFVSSYVIRPETGLGQGFDVYNAEFSPTSVERSVGQVQRPGLDTLAAAERWLDTLADDRFLLFFHIYEPHKPYAPPARHAGGDPYDGEVAFSDEIVGALLSSLKRRGWYDNAVIVVTADHGEGLDDHGEEEHGLFLYNTTIHVPWLVKLPGARGGGRRIADAVQHIDLVPTLARLAGLSVPTDLRGRDLSPALARGAPIEPQGIYVEALYTRYHFGWSELFALIDDRYKFIRAPKAELYDLARDPGERTNLIEDRPQASAALRSGLEALVAGKDLDAPSAVSDEDRQRLAALGYVGTHAPSAAAASGEPLPDPKDKASILARYRRAVDLIGRRQLDAGVALLEEILREDRDMTDVWAQYAGVLIKIGRLRRAFDAYREVIRLRPDEPTGLLGASSVLVGLGRLDEARAHAELAVKEAPAAAHQALANIALTERQFDEALRQADLAAKADPTLPLPVFVRGMIEYNQGRYQQALPFLLQARERAATRAMQMSDLHFFIADSLAQLDRYDEAERYFIEELRLYPHNTRAWSRLAVLYQSMDRPARAERAIADMLTASPTPQAYAAAANLWRMFGQPARSAAVREAARAKFGGGGS